MVDANGGPRTRVEEVYLRVREDIVDGHLAPGSRLAVEHLRDRYGVGSSTMRESLSLLVADALVTAEGQRGFAVASISLADLADLSRVRSLLESSALRASIAVGDDDWEAAIVAGFHRLMKAQDRVDAGEPDAGREWELRNREFHGALVAACGSAWTRRMLGMLHFHSERYRRFALVSRVIPRDVRGEHRQLFEAVLARDADRACTVLVEHIATTSDVIAVLLGESIEFRYPERKL